jgi:RNA polymerase sigma-70 factor (ECF subfamily)
MTKTSTAAAADVSDLPAGDAIPRLVDAHGGRLYGLGLKLCGNPEDAQDLVQEIFLQAYRKWDQFEGRADPSTWLYTIGARACQRMNRRRSGEPPRLEPLADLLPAEGDAVPDLEAEGPLDDQLRREAREAVERALEALPPDFRLALVLKEIAELPLADVARILGIKEATVKTRVHRGRLFLRKELAGGLPRRKAAAASHPRSVCLDLLAAKQEAMDRGVAYPVSADLLCERCEALFRTLDLVHEACRDLDRDTLPPEVRRLVLDRLDGGGAG